MKTKILPAPVLDPEFQKKFAKVQRYKFRNEQDILSKFPYPEELEKDSKNGIYSWHNRIVTDDTTRQHILEEERKDVVPSLGRERWLSILKQKYTGIGQWQVSAFLKQDDLHQIYNPRHKSSKTIPFVSKRPFSALQCDLTYFEPMPSSEKGNSRPFMLFTLIDKFTKYGFALPLARKTGKVVAAGFEDLFTQIESLGHKVGSIFTDHGTEFNNQDVYDVFIKHGVVDKKGKPLIISGQTYSPLSNGNVENFNRVLKTMMMSETAITGKKSGYVKPALLKSLKVYNESIHGATRMRPIDLIDPNLPSKIITEVRQRMISLQENNTEPNARFLPKINVGDSVRIDIIQLDDEKRKLAKAGQYKSSHDENYSKKVYHVKTCMTRNRFSIDEIPGRIFERGHLLLVNSDSKDVPEKAQDKSTESAEQPIGSTDVQPTILMKTKFVPEKMTLRNKKQKDQNSE